MSILNFSKQVYDRGLEPVMRFKVIESDYETTLVFSSWKSLQLQNILRYVEFCNVSEKYNMFKIKKVLNNPHNSYYDTRVLGKDLEIYEIPNLIFQYLLDNKLGYEKIPIKKELEWI